MAKFCNDVDVLKYEPLLFGELHLPAQVLAGGTGASLNGTLLTATEADFVGAGVEAGGVAWLKSSEGSPDGAYEIVSVDSATQLTVSVVRPDAADPAIAPPPGSDLSYRVSTLGPQIVEAAFQLTEYFGVQPGHPTSAVTVENLVDTEGLRRPAVFAVIASAYAMWAGCTEREGFWRKSLFYRQLFEQARQRCRVSVDLGSDGVADVIRVGGAIRLVRD